MAGPEAAPGGTGAGAARAVTAVCPAGGLAEEVDEKVLHAAFIPFGDITDIQIPLDYETGAWPGGGSGPAIPAREQPLGAELSRGGPDPSAARRVFAARDRSALPLQRSTEDSPSSSSSWQR